MKNKLSFLPLLLISVSAAYLFSQSNMQVLKLSGGSDNIPINSITKITFTNSDMVIEGAGKTVPIGDVQVILFNNNLPNITGVPHPSLFSNSICPNPFNPVTTLRLNLTQDRRADISIYNHLGAKVKTLFNNTIKAGNYQITWNGKNDRHQPVSSGLYIFSIKIDDKVINKKAVLLK